MSEKFLEYPSHSRIHPLNSFGPNVYVKRDDELSFGITGSKYRKYLSLIPWLLKKEAKEVVLIGSAYSNHVMGFSQLLIENGIKPIPFLLKGSNKKPTGNLLLTSMLCDEIHWIDRSEWSLVEEMADTFARARERCIVIPEGAAIPEALAGAKTLAEDIERNEKENGLRFDHILVDAGTGMTALGLAGMQAKIHVLLLAKSALELPAHFTCHHPENARSYGSVNRQVFNTIREIAKHEGILTDPIYSAKLFDEARRIFKDLEGNKLIVHSGGGLALMKYQDNLAFHSSIPSLRYANQTSGLEMLEQ